MMLFLDLWKENQNPLKVVDSRDRYNGVWHGKNLLGNNPCRVMWVFKSSSCITLLKIQSKLKHIVIPKGISGEIVNDDRVAYVQDPEKKQKAFRTYFWCFWIKLHSFLSFWKKHVFYLIKIYSMVIYGCTWKTFWSE